jgi:hypothetical protein
MTADARRIWREVIGAKPIDWFDAGSLPLLRGFCEAAAGASKLSVSLRQMESGSAEWMRTLTAWRMLSAQALASGKALRLTTQAGVGRHAAKNSERSDLSNGDERLLGGNA